MSAGAAQLLQPTSERRQRHVGQRLTTLVRVGHDGPAQADLVECLTIRP